MDQIVTTSLSKSADRLSRISMGFVRLVLLCHYLQFGQINTV